MPFRTPVFKTGAIPFCQLSAAFYVYTSNQPLFSSAPDHLSCYRALDYTLCTKDPESLQLQRFRLGCSGNFGWRKLWSAAARRRFGLVSVSTSTAETGESGVEPPHPKGFA